MKAWAIAILLFGTSLEAASNVCFKVDQNTTSNQSKSREIVSIGVDRTRIDSDRGMFTIFNPTQSYVCSKEGCRVMDGPGGIVGMAFNSAIKVRMKSVTTTRLNKKKTIAGVGCEMYRVDMLMESDMSGMAGGSPEIAEALGSAVQKDVPAVLTGCFTLALGYDRMVKHQMKVVGELDQTLVGPGAKEGFKRWVAAGFMLESTTQMKMNSVAGNINMDSRMTTTSIKKTACDPKIFLPGKILPPLQKPNHTPVAANGDNDGIGVWACHCSKLGKYLRNPLDELTKEELCDCVDECKNDKTIKRMVKAVGDKYACFEEAKKTRAQAPQRQAEPREPAKEGRPGILTRTKERAKSTTERTIENKLDRAIQQEVENLLPF